MLVSWGSQLEVSLCFCRVGNTTSRPGTEARIDSVAGNIVGFRRGLWRSKGDPEAGINAAGGGDSPNPSQDG